MPGFSTDWHTWPRSHAGIDTMLDKMNLDNLKLLYCEFHKYEVMTMSVVGAQPSNTHKSQLYEATNRIERTFLIPIISSYCFLSLDWLVG